MTKKSAFFAVHLLLVLLLPFVSFGQPAGANMSNPLVMGTYGQGTFNYSNTKNNSTANGFLNDYGQASDDIYYKFTIQGNATVSISHCGSGFDTYMYLLNSAGTLIASNDDNGPLCTGTTASMTVSLTPGIYYIISEGYYTYTGNITTTVNLTVQAPPAPVDTRNFIKTWQSTAPETDPNNLMTRPLADQKHSVTYFDGLGRAEQSIVKKGSLSAAGNTDLVTASVYDASGREVQKYLPYPSPSSDGLYKPGVLTEQANFYNSAASPLNAQSEEIFFAKTDFEASPAGRVVKNYPPGNNWAGSSRGVETKYWTNTGLDDVKIWSVTDVVNAWGSYAAGAAYPAGSLYKTVTVDEHNHQVIEFKDKDDKVVLKKVQLTASPDGVEGQGYPGWLCTYYIYDDLKNLRCVVQPRGVELLIENSWNINALSGDILNEQCFRYEYDTRNRMIMKKVPGAGDTWMVYDVRDRLVMTQDANMRSAAVKKWSYTVYDNNTDRPVSTGLLYDPANYNNLTYHRATAWASTGYPVISNYTTEELTRTFYDDYSWLPGEGNPVPSNRYTGDDAFFITPGSSYPYAQPLTQSGATKSLVTGVKTKVLGSTQYLYTVNFYDPKGRTLQTFSQTSTGGVIIFTTQYNFAGAALVTYQTTGSGLSNQTTGLITKYEYDDLDRLLKVKKQLLTTFGAGAAENTIVQNEYNALGQLKTKKLAPTYNSNAGLETEAYDYNIRGWLLGMNRNYLSSTGQSGTTKFGFELGYDKYSNSSGRPFNVAWWNGNISGMVWKSDGDDVKRKYDYTYDAANRLLAGVFEQDDATNSWNSSTMNFYTQTGSPFDPNACYDANGNIKSMFNMGWKLGGSGVIDNLAYKYETNSNKLRWVYDNEYSVGTKAGDFQESAQNYTDNTASNIADYSYDANGNMMADKNKNIDNIVYNHLNLPAVITIPGKGTITYLYDATGNKLKKTTADITQPGKTITTTTYYIGGAVYETKTNNPADPNNPDYTDVLQFLPHEEGRIRFKPAIGTSAAQFIFDYFLKDHLGNVRMVLTDYQGAPDVYPAATLENTTYNGNTAVSEEGKYYSIDPLKVVDQIAASGIPAYNNNNGNPPYNTNPYSNTGAASNRLYKLNAATNSLPNKMGLGIALKVMAGDNINIFAKSYHKMPVSGGYSSPVNSIAVSEIIGALAGTALVMSKGVTGSQITGQAGFPTTVNGLVGNQPAQTSATPKAGINWIVLDEQFKYITGGFDMVGTAVNSTGTFKNHDASTMPTIPITKNGYIYVYCNNESQYDVFFDNLQLVHAHGPILEETHYYPFGLTMAGISSKALGIGGVENRKKFNDGTELSNKEFSDGSGLELYETSYRSYDPQLGRFHQIDPLSFITSDQSPYQFALNNPMLRNDPSGLSDTATLKEVFVIGKLKGGQYNGQNFDDIKPIMTINGGLIKRVYTNSSAVTMLGKEIQESKISEQQLKLVGEVGGTLAIPKTTLKIKEFIKLLVTGKAIPKPSTALATLIYLEGFKQGMNAKDLQSIVDTYIEIHKDNPSGQTGIYTISLVTSVPSSINGSNTITNTAYYDISTKQYLGETNSR